MKALCAQCRAAARHRFEVGGYAVHRCARCDLEFVWPLPDDAALARVYEQGYFSGGGAGYGDYFDREREQVARKSRERLGALRSLGVSRGDLLELGAASGFFLGHARDAGFTVRGVEPAADALAAMEPSLRPRVVARLEDLAAGERFDVVAAFDVLEHLRDPASTLAAVRARMRPSGIVAVVVPVLGSTTTRLAPRLWDQYKPPEHLWFWSPRAMRALLAAQGFGTVHEAPAWRRPSRFVDLDGTSRAPLTRLARAVDVLAHRAVVAAVGDVAVTDSMAFYARVVP